MATAVGAAVLVKTTGTVVGAVRVEGGRKESRRPRSRLRRVKYDVRSKNARRISTKTAEKLACRSTGDR